MGVGISGWRLARTVARHGQLGVVSGTGVSVTLARRLQDGDLEGHLRRALEAFPAPAIAQQVLARYLRPGGRHGAPYRPLPLFRIEGSPELHALSVAAGFAEVWLAREGHNGRVGINLLEKMQLQTLPTLYGALLAGVDVVLMGAGIPREIPQALDQLARHERVRIGLSVAQPEGAEPVTIDFDPRAVLGVEFAPLKRPAFLPIVASAILAQALLRHAPDGIQGFVIEGPLAGGHNAPPRGRPMLNERGEPQYGPRDAADLDAIRALGVPFWLAGAWAAPGRLREALALGAAGIQVGTAFAFCRESGLRPDLRDALLARVRRGEADVFTDPRASPTGFPFKVAQLEGSLSEPSTYAERDRVCDVGYLRHAYRAADGTLGLRCPAEPLEAWARHAGAAEEAEGRKCLCNALLANVGLSQVRPDDRLELPLVTSGDDLRDLGRLLPPDSDSYSAEDVLRSLLA